MNRLLIGLVALLALLPGAQSATSEVCYHGCSTLNVNVLDYVLISQPNEQDCNLSCSGQGGIEYQIQKTTGCGGTLIMGIGTFCTDENLLTGTYQVNAIGSGCSGSAQGCVRLCPCP